MTLAPSRPLTARWLLRAAAALGTVGLASAAYQTAAEARDRKRLPPPGRLADASGRRLQRDNPALVSSAIRDLVDHIRKTVS
jgi:hypothetical protein